ncbi:peptide methionine sulfoxide reductase MsrA-like [Patiria miniata]|uniref:peptide-methionine (S)-S-oxide reductase n=1 Tax=Patiria miniata TaxID=46514 RepID=A0A914AA31_PATMI|nr:peptide methionine sulfoxide reductase MsrA-like [Patiria miniata]XP_038060622.1 peptide methionine sulfoxide reductase MsrA-like [Patiria miniata]XP_038060623.1 peptide methionine sulfoxide reductase MsrA-like [Patiria miniata]
MKSCIGLGLILVAVFCVTTADEYEDTPVCTGETKRLMEQRFRPSHLSYQEPDVPTLKATFSMGCFWGVESVFGALPGVIRVKVGYTGGIKENPTYESLDDHTESVEIEFDPERITYASLLETFWANHNPSDLKPVQYMSAIFYHDYIQMKSAEDSKLNQRRVLGEDTLTKIKRAKVFYDAEDYHQKYFLRQHANFVQSLGLTDQDFLSSWRATKLLGYITGNGDEQNLKQEKDALGLTDDHMSYLAAARKSGKEGRCSAAKKDEL